MSLCDLLSFAKTSFDRLRVIRGPVHGREPGFRRGDRFRRLPQVRGSTELLMGETAPARPGRSSVLYYAGDGAGHPTSRSCGMLPIDGSLGEGHLRGVLTQYFRRTTF